MTATRTLAQWLEAMSKAQGLPAKEHAAAMAEHAAAQAAVDAAKADPGAYTQADRRRLASELLETTAALEMVPADSVPYLTEKTKADFLTSNAPEMATAGRVKLAENCAKMPQLKTTLTGRVIESTRAAFGMGAADRTAALAKRDKHEETLAWLEARADSASTKIEYFAHNPNSDALSAMLGGLGALEAAQAEAAAEKS